MTNVSFLRPRWFNNLSYNRKGDRLLMNRFFIKNAALLATPEGTLAELAKALGTSEVTLHYTHSERDGRGRISADLATRIQKLCGEERMPLKLLRPDLFD